MREKERKKERKRERERERDRQFPDSGPLSETLHGLQVQSHAPSTVVAQRERRERRAEAKRLCHNIALCILGASGHVEAVKGGGRRPAAGLRLNSG